MALEILTCGACGGQVPLGDGDVLQCPFCQGKVELPPAHRELRDAERRDAAARTQAKELFAHYGKKPSLLLRACAILFNPWFLLLDGFFLLLLVFMIGYLFLGQLISMLIHNNLWDTIPDAPKGYGMFVFGSATMLGGIALGVSGRRKALATRGLQAALAARPPTRPGESAGCRECGAPLFVRGGEEGVRCIYCKTDNLVDVPRDWIEGVVADRARIGREIEQADAWVRSETARQKRSLRRQIGLAGFVLVAFISIIAAKGANPDWRSLWDRFVVERYLVLNDHKSVPINQCAPIACGGEPCFMYVALRRGERFSLEGAPYSTVAHTHFWWGKDLRENFGTPVPVENSSFVAPWSSWYQLRVVAPSASLCPHVN
jgi:hypothetical protein